MIDRIEKLIDKKISELNTFEEGIITSVNLSKMRCNVKLKHKIQGHEIELFDVPIKMQRFGGSIIILAPAKDDIVTVGFSKYELKEQLKNKDIVAVNEILIFNLNHAFVIIGSFTDVDTAPAELAENTIVIKHKSGNYIKFKPEGGIELKGNVDITGTFNVTGGVTITGAVSITGNVIINGDLDVNGNLTFDYIQGTAASAGTWHKHT